jgi:hypothetical protein
MGYYSNNDYQRQPNVRLSLLPRERYAISLKEEEPFFHSFVGGLVRYRTAAILSAVMIVGMFGLPAAVMAVFLLSL